MLQHLRAAIEVLELRVLLTSIKGTNNNDVIHVGVHPDVPRSYFIDINERASSTARLLRTTSTERWSSTA